MEYDPLLVDNKSYWVSFDSSVLEILELDEALIIGSNVHHFNEFIKWL